MRTVTWLVIVVVFTAMPVGAQTVPELRIDMQSDGASVPKELEVDDWARVRVVVEKNMFHSCTVETKTEALPPPPNPVAQILGALTPMIGGAAVAAPAAASVDRGDPGLEAQVDALVKDAVAVVQLMNEQSEEVEELVKGLPARTACNAADKKSDPCGNEPAAQNRLTTLIEDLQHTPTKPLASTALLSSRAAELTKSLVGRMVQAKPEEAVWLKSAFDRLRWAQENIEFAAERRAALLKAREALLVMRERLIAFRPTTVSVFPVTPAGNSRATATVTCINVVTQQPIIYSVSADKAQAALSAERVSPVAGNIVFRNKPWATVTGGLLVSSVDKRQVTIAPHKTGVDDAGVVTVARRVTETDLAGSQVVPFTFFNLVIPRLSNRKYFTAGSLGIGLNPNNGSKTVEYFLGGSIGIGRVVVFNVGLHLGTRMEPENGFQVADTVPATLAVVPTQRARKNGFAFGISYGVPLPK